MENKEIGSNFYMLTAQVLNDKNLNHAEKLTMAMLNGLSREDGTCYPSNEWLQEKLGLKETAVKDILRHLEENNYIRREIFSCSKNPFKKYRIIHINTNFKLCLPGSENRLIEKSENRLAMGRKTDPIIDKKELIDKEYKEAPASPGVSAEADLLYTFFFEKLRERNPEFKEPNKKAWLKELDLLLRVDKRNLEKVKEIIEWASEHNWWKTACLSPSKLRKDYDAMLMQMNGESDKNRIRVNRAFAISMKEKHPEHMRSLSFDDKFAMNSKNGKEIPFNLPEEIFKDALINMFGGTYVRPVG